MNRIETEANSLHEGDLNGTSADEWVDHFTRKYSIQPITLLPAAPILEKRVDRVEHVDPFGYRYSVEQEIALVGLPVEDNGILPELLKFEASRWVMSHPQWEYRNGCIFIQVRGTDTEAARRAIGTVKQCIEWLNTDIRNGNSELPGFILRIIKQRMEVVGAREQSFKNLAEALGAELRLTSGTEQRLYRAPRMKESISQLRRPQPRRTTSPHLKPEEFQTILAVIDAQCRTFERTPSTVAKLQEEDIRNVILGALNAAFDLGAVGEAFSNRGKTDILLAVPDGGVFIAEARIWDGPKTVSDALEQIRGYLIWRDTHGLVLLFSRNRGFSNVLAAIPEACEHEPLHGEVHKVGDNHWMDRHALPGDDHRLAEIHYVAYNIYAGS